MPLLTLLGEPAWEGAPLSGDRSIALLACLHLAGAEGVGVDRLVTALWPEDVPAHAEKALHVVVSRTRKATAPDAVQRLATGYRLGPCDVDALVVEREAERAASALRAGDVRVAAEHARLALEVGIRGDTESGPLAQVRERAREQQRRARRTQALALARGGSSDLAYPALQEVLAWERYDDEVLLALLLAEAAAVGPAAALQRYETHRRDLAERLGVDPSQELQRAHAQLLAADRPTRHGIRYDADALVGRDDELGTLLGLLSRHRVVTILGPGGLGKTRMAQLVARHAPESTVHVVELVGVRAGEDVVGEVGSTLGVRDSVSSMSALTPAQRADVRGRIAGMLDRSPTLLVLDNCEHVIDEVAELVASLVAATRDLKVLTTSRRPLAISAERVHPLAQLDLADAARLFELRATAARPGVLLDDAQVARVVSRLDGLPLAIELAAAKTRVMSVSEIDRRLSNRFELLRDGDRAAPGRHQTLLAVIDWSWTLLEPEQRRALRRLSVFSDGFTLDAAEAVLGDLGVEDVAALVDQSLLTVVESGEGVRYRMLETVREFGLMHLVDTGEDVEAYAARRRWAMSFVEPSITALFSAEQPAEVSRLLREEVNLSDVLRGSLAEGDPDTAVALMAALATLWTIRGEHARVMMLSEPVDALLAEYDPQGRARDECRVTAAWVQTTASYTGSGAAMFAPRVLAELGPGEGPAVAALVRVTSLMGDSAHSPAVAGLTELIDSDDRLTRSLALQLSARVRENAGDTQTALAQIAEALETWRPDDGIWARAMMHMTFGQLAAQKGDLRTGASHAALALPDLLLLQATDDAIDARAIMAIAALSEGDIAAAEALVAANAAGVDNPWVFGGAVVNLSIEAEIALARGDVAVGLTRYRQMATAMRRNVETLRGSDGPAPWALYGLAAATCAHAVRGEGEDLYDELAGQLPAVLASQRPDFPVLGLVLFALALAGLQHDRIGTDVAVGMLALADRFSYARLAPSTSWENAEVLVAARGLDEQLAEAVERLGDRRGAALLDELNRLVARLER